MGATAVRVVLEGCALPGRADVRLRARPSQPKERESITWCVRRRTPARGAYTVRWRWNDPPELHLDAPEVELELLGLHERDELVQGAIDPAPPGRPRVRVSEATVSDARPERPQADVPRSAVNPHRLEENRRQRRATTLMCALAMAALVGRSGVTLLPSDEHVDGLHRKENIGRRAPETGVNVGTPSELKAEDTTPALDLIGCAPPRRAVRKPLLRGHEHAYFSAQRSHLGTTKGASGRAPSTGNAGIRSPACSGRPRTRRHGRGSGSAGGPARARARTR